METSRVPKARRRAMEMARAGEELRLNRKVYKAREEKLQGQVAISFPEGCQVLRAKELRQLRWKDFPGLYKSCKALTAKTTL